MMRIFFTLQLNMFMILVTSIAIYFKVDSAILTGIILLHICIVVMFIMAVVSKITYICALKRGTPILGVITKRSHGLYLFGNKELVLYVTYTDGSRLLMTKKCNTYQCDYTRWLLGSFVMLCEYKGDYYVNDDNMKLENYFSDNMFELLDNLIADSDIKIDEDKDVDNL